jgi:hypothetical protein
MAPKLPLFFRKGTVKNIKVDDFAKSYRKVKGNPAWSGTDGLFTKPSWLDDDLNGTILSFREGMECFFVFFQRESMCYDPFPVQNPSGE